MDRDVAFAPQVGSTFATIERNEHKRKERPQISQIGADFPEL